MVLLDNGGGVRDEVQITPPPPELRHLVEHIWVQRWPPNASEWRIVPDASPHLIAVVTGGRRFRADLVGPRSRLVAVDTRRRIVTVGVRLRPGGIPALLRVPARELLDRTVPLRDAFSSRVIHGLNMAADAPPALLATELLEILRRAAGAGSGGPLAMALDRVASVRGITEALAMPERTLRDRALREIGLPPKRALRIIRLHRALMMARKRLLPWAGIADAAGYADQAHLARECRALLGDTPSQWIGRASADLFKTGAGASL